MKILKFITLCFLTNISFLLWGWPGMDMPALHVEGRFLVDENGNKINLHGFGQTYSPWFNEQGSKWSNYDVEKCLSYNKGLIDDIMEAGWKVNFLRLHMDPYWSNTPGLPTTGENDISAFDFSRFRQYLNSVFIPMAEYAVSKGLYVVMRPPGVCPEDIAVGDDYHKYLKKIWGYVSTEPALVNNPHIMFELANEPVRIKGKDGVYSSSGDACFQNLTIFFQEIVDLMRNNGCENILWVPGTGYQSQYAGFAKYPIKGKNIGYAVHVYPGWYGSDAIEPSHELGGNYGGGFGSFASGWESQIMPAAEIAPIMVTEMDWAPSAYNASWGKSITGKMFGEGFGGNFKLLADMTGNVSWMIFTGPELLAKFKSNPATNSQDEFLTDPAACPWPVYHWFKEYAGEEIHADAQLNFFSYPSLSDNSEEITVMPGTRLFFTVVGTAENGYELNHDSKVKIEIKNDSFLENQKNTIKVRDEGEGDVKVGFTIDENEESLDFKIISTCFPLTSEMFNPSIWEPGTFDPSVNEVKTGLYGFAGWHYSSPLDFSGYEKIIAELEGENKSSVSFRIFDTDNYWSDPAVFDFNQSKIIEVNPINMVSNNGRKLDPSHIYYVGFWSTGSAPFRISRVSGIKSDKEENYIETISDKPEAVNVYNLQGRKLKSSVSEKDALSNLPPGVYIVGNKKVYINNFQR